MNCTSWALFGIALWPLSVGKDGAQGPSDSSTRGRFFKSHRHRKGDNREMDKGECRFSEMIYAPAEPHLKCPLSSYPLLLLSRGGLPSLTLMNHPVLSYGKKHQVNGERLTPEGLACISLRTLADAVLSAPPFLALIRCQKDSCTS